MPLHLIGVAAAAAALTTGAMVVMNTQAPPSPPKITSPSVAPVLAPPASTMVVVRVSPPSPISLPVTPALSPRSALPNDSIKANAPIGSQQLVATAKVPLVNQDTATTVGSTVHELIPPLAVVEASSINAIASSVSSALGVQQPSNQILSGILADYSRVYRCMYYQYSRWFMKGVIESTVKAAVIADPSLAAVAPEMGRISAFLSQGITPTLSDCVGYF